MSELTKLSELESMKPFLSDKKTARDIQADWGMKKSLVGKLAEVQLAVGRVPKRGHNQHFNYDFATESDITAAIRKEMAERQIVMFPDVQSLTYREINGRNGIQTIACVMVKFTIRDGETREEYSFCVPGEGQDSGDKAVPKALTSATKYALLKLYLIPTGDDPERDEKPEKAKAAASAQPSTTGAAAKGTDVGTVRGNGAEIPPSKNIFPASPVNGELITAEWDGRGKGSIIRANGDTLLFYTAKVAEVAKKAMGAQWPVRLKAKRSEKGNWYVTDVEPVEEGIAF